MFFFFNDTATTEIYTLSLHDALPISTEVGIDEVGATEVGSAEIGSNEVGSAEVGSPEVDSAEVGSVEVGRSEEHTSELQSPCNLVCRLLLEKKKTIKLRDRSTMSRCR